MMAAPSHNKFFDFFRRKHNLKQGSVKQDSVKQESASTNSIPGISYVKKHSLDDAYITGYTPNDQDMNENRLEAVLPSPYDFLQNRPTPIEKPEDVQQLQEALLPSPFDFDYSNNNSNSTDTKLNPVSAEVESLRVDLENSQLFNTKLITQSGYNDTYIEMPIPPNVSSNVMIKKEAKKTVYKRKSCSVEGCTNLSRSKGLCKAHGGGRRCSYQGCNRASQSGSLCISHGGGKRCIVEGCTKAAQSRGMCKGHGGGVRCKAEGCTKSSQGDGFCRTHGGGRRCGHPSGCTKWAQRNGMCMVHSGGKYGNSYRGRMQRLKEQQEADSQTKIQD